MMTTIQVEVQDDLVQQLGVVAVRHLLEEELSYQRFKLLENRIQSTMQAVPDIDWEDEFEKARQQAYDAYRQNRRTNS